MMSASMFQNSFSISPPRIHAEGSMWLPPFLGKPPDTRLFRGGKVEQRFRALMEESYEFLQDLGRSERRPCQLNNSTRRDFDDAFLLQLTDGFTDFAGVKLFSCLDVPNRQLRTGVRGFLQRRNDPHHGSIVLEVSLPCFCKRHLRSRDSGDDPDESF